MNAVSAFWGRENLPARDDVPKPLIAGDIPEDGHNRVGHPAPLEGSGASRVQSTKPSAVGSPEATPSVKVSAPNRGLPMTRPTASGAATAAHAMLLAACKSCLRVSGWTLMPAED